MSREYTKEEVRNMVLTRMKHLAQYWATSQNAGTVKDRCEGVAFSILTMIDGCASGMPAFDLVARPHKDDKAFQIAEGENWMPDGMVINDDCQMHDMFYEDERAERAAQAAKQGE